MLNISEEQKNDLKVHYKNGYASLNISHHLDKLIIDNMAIVCIGTDRCIVDCLGPLVGTMLAKENVKLNVYGTLDNPVHGINIDERLKEIKKMNYDTIIAIDACLSSETSPGIIEIKEGSLTPGKGIGKQLPTIGDISIIGIVETSQKNFNELINGTGLSIIYNMAEVISAGILNAVNYKNNILEEVAYE